MLRVKACRGIYRGLCSVSNLTGASPGEGSSLCQSVSYLVSYMYLLSHSPPSLPSLDWHYNEVYCETSTYKFSKRKVCLQIVISTYFKCVSQLGPLM